MRKELQTSGFFFFFCLHWQKYQVLLKSQETRASHVTQPWANNWKRYKTGPWLSRLLMSVAMLALGLEEHWGFAANPPDVSTYHVLFQTPGWSWCALTGFPPLSHLRLLRATWRQRSLDPAAPFSDLPAGSFFFLEQCGPIAQLGSVPRLCTRGQLHSSMRAGSL